MPMSAIQCCPQLFGHPVTCSLRCWSKLGIADTTDHMVTPMTTWLGQNKEAVSKRFVGGMSTDVDSVFKMITASDHAMKGGTIFPTFDEAHRAMGDTLPYLQGAEIG